ncbi:MAG: type IX secretion system sortase PorU [Urechidicola sp.]|nr:type IX secretion system sortase PorU [Urechidicola sp.]
MNRLKYILFAVIFSSIITNAQNAETKKINLKWNESSVFTSRNNQLSIPTIENQFLNDNQNPSYSESWAVANGLSVKSHKLTNVQYQVLSADVANQLNLENVPTTLISSVEVAKSRNKSEMVLVMTPLIKEGTLVKKITSFTLEYELQSAISSRGSTTNRAYNSVLSSGNWYKFAVDTTGVFRLSRSFLQSLGMDVNNVNPKNIKIYGNGGAMLPQLNSDFRYDDLEENAIFVSGEDDGNFDNNDYILFYAKGPHKWNSVPTANTAQHQFNIYSDEAFYFVTASGDTGKRIQDDTPIIGSPSQQITNYNDYTFHEKDEVNILFVGQQWFGEDFSYEDTQTFTIPFENIDNTQDISIRVRAVAESFSTSNMSVTVNGQEVVGLNFPALTLGSLIHAFAREGAGTIPLTGDSVTVVISYNNNGNPSAKAHLDFIEVIGKKKLINTDLQFGFRNFDVANATGISQYQIQNATEVWDVTDYTSPVRITNQSESGNFEFNANAGSLKEYVSLNDANYFEPNTIQDRIVSNQNLHAIEDVDYVVVTRDYLMGEVERLADFHRQRGLTVEVVDINQIYNEFSSGSPDLTAIRDFTKYLYDNATSPDKRIKYLCLFGDASYDYKDRITGNNNVVPVFLAFESFNLATSYMTDDYYGMMDPNEGLLSSTDKQDVATGRIPITTTLQASQAIDKIINYNGTNSFGDWRNLVTVVADDLDVATEAILQSSMERIADSINDRKPLLNVKKIYADAYVQETTAGGERYPDVYDDIERTLEKGTLLLNYFGHGGEDGWASERILDIPLVGALNNYNEIPLIITITCEFSRFDNPLRISGGEVLVWNEGGGSISLITTTREIYINVGRVFNERLMKVLLKFDDNDLTISESLMEVKNQFSTSQRLFVYYLGDPAMNLAVPKADIRLTRMNGVDITQSTDTIKALSHITFDGIVTTPTGELLTDYNGELSTIVFDKPLNKTTLNNDNHGIYMEFDALESKIFRGLASVENGQFTFDFIAPRDLRIAYGEGKISFYSDDNVVDKAGYNFDIIIGGINENAPEDNQGPQIQLYMNDETFVDGGNTNASPFLLAVLEDENGINTSITAVDHDIVAILDGDAGNPYILNDFYQTELNDYTKGSAKFPFRNLKAGLHTVELCAWDTYNNVSCATLSFVVVNDSEMVLDNVLNYPNPFVNYTEFWFNHNKPNESLEVQVQIFTVSGKLVKTINETVQSTGNLSRSVTWDGLDDFGDKIGKGVYVYKLNVRSVLSDVKAEKYEKLVILQ